MTAETQLVLRTLHLLGAVLWIGGTAAAAVIVASGAAESRAAIAAAARRAVLLVVTPGLLLAWIAGLVVLASGWSAVYSKAGWMHAKVTLALVITGLTGFLTGRLRKAAAAEAEARAGLVGAVALAVVALALGILGLVRFQPFGSSGHGV